MPLNIFYGATVRDNVVKTTGITAIVASMKYDGFDNVSFPKEAGSIFRHWLDSYSGEF